MSDQSQPDTVSRYDAELLADENNRLVARLANIRAAWKVYAASTFKNRAQNYDAIQKAIEEDA